jgi:hypothetical protein
VNDKLYIYACQCWAWDTKEPYLTISAETEVCHWGQFLFEIKTEWLPDSKEEALRMLKHYGYDFPSNTQWAGWVPF